VSGSFGFPILVLYDSSVIYLRVGCTGTVFRVLAVSNLPVSITDCWPIVPAMAVLGII
jgi:hypothetical protein